MKLRITLALMLLMTMAGLAKAQDAYPSETDLIGKSYNFKGTVTRENTSSKYDDYMDYLPTEFTFEFVDVYEEIKLKDFLINVNTSVNYYPESGSLQIAGNYGNAINKPDLRIGFADAEKGWAGIGKLYSNFIWQVDKEGKISIPDFIVVDYSITTNPPVIAKYTNITINGQGGDESGEGGNGDDQNDSYPDASKFVNDYIFNADRELLDNKYDQQLATGFRFTLAGSGNNLSASDFLGSNQGISFEYNQEEGKLALTSNTLRYGTIGSYTNLGLADIDGTWTGMGRLFVTVEPWMVDKDGTITIPDFSVVDYSTYNKATNSPATVLAKFRNVKLSKVNQEEEAKKASFEGTYRFAGTLTRTPVEGYHTEEGTSLHSYIAFKINEYNQITSFNEYKDILLADKREGDYLYNRGEVNVDGDIATYRIDMSTTNYVQLIQSEYDEDGEAIEGTSFIKRFGGEGNDWTQDNEAFTLTRTGNETDGFTYTLTPLSLFERYGVKEGDKTEYYDTQFALWQDIKYIGDDAIIIASNLNATVDNRSDEVTLTLDMRGSHFEDLLVKSYKLEIIQLDNSGVSFPSEIENVNINNGKAKVVLKEAPAGDFELRIQLVALDTAGNEYARSNSQDIAFTVTPEGRKDYPEEGKFDGTYRFKAEKFNLGNESYEEFFKQEFEFSIETTFSQNSATGVITPIIMVKNFLYEGLIFNTEYDKVNGKLKLKPLTFTPAGEIVAFDPNDGVWGGISALNGNFLTFEIGENGEVSIPGFRVGPYDANGLTKVYGEWDYITVEKEEVTGNDVTYVGSREGSTTTDSRDYVLNYHINHNADGTLSISGSFAWNDDRDDYLHDIIVYVDGTELGRNDYEWTIFTTEKQYREGTEVSIEFRTNYGINKQASHIVTYVVGRQFDIQLVEDENDDKLMAYINHHQRLITISTGNDYASIKILAPEGAKVYYMDTPDEDKNEDGPSINDLSSRRVKSGYVASSDNVVNLNKGNSGTLSVYYELNGTESEPIEYAYSVGAEIPTAVDSVNVESTEVEYYNLNGIRVKNPDNGIYIKISGNKAEKVIIR